MSSLPPINYNIQNEVYLNFGFKSFRSGQEEIINSILIGNDTLVIMPTGGGKSLCYQLPALILDGSAVVISPLISLMKDQTDALKSLNLRSTYINSSLTSEEISQRVESIINGEYKLIYIAPERLESKKFVSILDNIKISFIAIDEAHCVSEWGHDFRPSYLNIPKFFPEYKNLTKVALTATATPEVQNDIIDLLKMQSVKRFVKGFDRPNHNYQTILSRNKEVLLQSIIKKNPNVIRIIYCGSRKRVERYNSFLSSKGFKSAIYHGGLESAIRESIQDKFISNEIPIIVATNAFGMGIDHPNVRQVIHLDYTQTLEAYYQEAGRAGRDGLPADCKLIHYYSDKKLQEYFINATYPSKDKIKLVYEKLFDLPQIALGHRPNKEQYINEVLLANLLNLPVNTVHSILRFLERNNIIHYELPRNNLYIKINSEKKYVIEYFDNTDEFTRNIFECVLRNLSSEAFSRPVYMNLDKLAEKYLLKNEHLDKVLRKLELQGILSFYDELHSSITFRNERSKFEDLSIDWDKYYARKEFAYKKLEVMINYARTNECKRAFILNYFSEDYKYSSCGNCSSCSTMDYHKDVPRKVKDTFANDIIKAAKFLNSKFGKNLLIAFIKGNINKRIESFQLHQSQHFGICKSFSIAEIELKIEEMIDDGYLKLTADNYPKIYTNIELEEDFELFEMESLHSKIDDELLSELKKLRQSINIRENLPINLIADDKSLKMLARFQPINIKDLNDLKRYEIYINPNFINLFLEIISSHIDKGESISKINKPIDARTLNIIELLESGVKLNQIAEKMQLTVGEIALIIQNAIQNGYKFNAEIINGKLILEKIKVLLIKNSNIPLRIIRANLEDEIEFPKLRILVAIARQEINHSR